MNVAPRRRRYAITFVLGACACGPQVPVDVDGSSTGATDAGDTYADATTAVLDDGPLPVTSGTTVAGTDDTSSADGFGTGYEDDGGSDGGCTFTCPNPPGPGGGGGGVFECDLEAQDCPEGEKCMPWANDGGAYWNATRCSPLSPDPAAAGEACQVEGSFVSGIDDCELGAMCQSDDLDVSDGSGTCVAFCSARCDDPGDACLQLFAGVPTCTRPCDPLDPGGCPAGRVCGSIVAQDGASGFVCMPVAAEGVTEDMPCQFPHQCSPGLFCAATDEVPGCNNGASGGCCVPVCDTADPEPTCPAASGRICASVGAVPGSQWEALGICVLP